MSEEGQVFRGDRAPERSQVDGDSVRRKPAAPAAAEVAPVKTDAARTDPAAESPATPDTPDTADLSAVPAVAAVAAVDAAAPPAAPPAPELKLEVDASQLWHANEVLRQRIAQLHSTAAATAHQLDAQEEESRRIAKQLKSL